ncbi:hypothetical protein DPMN_142108 [Dreissena polymorpha]|uniref:Uncharacterized protein n=1 Tax=Dreissena polymorpha TaxID=45954 RepID=A0A9D4GDY6_DREPO|nr:hypothetical protein DPMN_142108 [Dreissena polymorpha]
MATVEEAPICLSIADPDVIAELEHETTVSDDVIQAYSLSSKDWRQSQMSDTVMAELINHIQKGTRPTPQSISSEFSAAQKYLRD